MADVIPVEEEESTMGTHEIDKHVCCLVIKPDAMEKVTFCYFFSFMTNDDVINHIFRQMSWQK